MKIVALSPFTYGAKANSGGELAGGTLLRGLARRHDVSVVAFAHEADQAARDAVREEMLDWASEVILMPLTVDRRAKIRAKLAPLLLEAADARYYASCNFDQLARAAVARIDPDAVLVQFPQMAQHRSVAGDRATVLDVQDAFSVSQWRRVLSARGRADRLLRLLAWWGWVRYERRCYTEFDALMTLSEQDRDGLTLFRPELSPIVVPPILPLAVRAAPVTDGSAPPRVGFVGAFNHPPNVEAVRFLLAEAWPGVAARRPDAELHIAGRGLPPAVVRDAPRVTYHGFVDDLPGFLGRMDVIVAPLRSGGGVKIKVLEALAAGRPVVTTSIGAEGIAAQDGVHLLIRNTAALIGEALLNLLGDKTARDSLSAAGAALFAASYSETALLDRVDTVLHDAVARAASRR